MHWGKSQTGIVCSYVSSEILIPLLMSCFNFSGGSLSGGSLIAPYTQHKGYDHFEQSPGIGLLFSPLNINAPHSWHGYVICPMYWASTLVSLNVSKLCFAMPFWFFLICLLCHCLSFHLSQYSCNSLFSQGSSIVQCIFSVVVHFTLKLQRMCCLFYVL